MKGVKVEKLQNGTVFNWSDFIKKSINAVLNIIFPPRCRFCSKIMDWLKEEVPVCKDCFGAIRLIGSEACNYCGKSLESVKNCSCVQDGHEIYYSKAYSACEYYGLIREKLLVFKFSGRKEMSEALAWLIVRKLEMTNEKSFDIIISVPMHETNLKKRGYNQSELIAEHIASYYSKPIAKNNLIKTKITLTQSKLDRGERIKNIRDAFKIVYSNEIKDKEVLLIDDILTTGSTVNECSKILQEAGAKKVIVATAATGRILND